jgi:uncharacterized protein YgiM (DUF1202 family)
VEGSILHFDRGSDQGFIRTTDGNRYQFSFADWRSPGQPNFGDSVDFEADDGRARAIFLLRAASGEAAVPPVVASPEPGTSDSAPAPAAFLAPASSPPVSQVPAADWVQDAEPPLPFWRKPVGIGAIAALTLLLLGLFWVNRFEWLGVERPGAEMVGVTGEETSLFVVADANLRSKATAQGSSISGKVPRGTKVSGVMQMGDDGISRWFKLADGRGFIGGVNLSVKEPPRLAKTFKDKDWSPATDLELRTLPDASSLILETVKPGSKLILAGLTESGYAEVKLTKGGVGYFSADGINLDESAAPPIKLSFNPGTCAFGTDLDALFQTEMAAQTRRETELEGRSYADEDERQQASIDFDNKTHFTRISRSANGLTMSAIAVRQDTRFIYFANSADEVIAAFRKLGFTIESDGVFGGNADEESSVYISGTSGEALSYGKASLTCGG